MLLLGEGVGGSDGAEVCGEGGEVVGGSNGDDGWGIEYDSDEDKRDEDKRANGTEESAKKSDMGGCGCVTDEVEENDDEVSDESDSEESDDEEEITIEVDLSQEIYTPPAQDTTPYKKRKRAPKNDRRPNCRRPRQMGAIERALRSASSKKENEYIFEPIIGMVFDSRTEAKEFYNMYSWEVGFGVKFDGSRPGSKSATKAKIDGEEEYKSMQEIACQRAGSDSRTTTGTKRCGCPAKIRLLRTDDHGWYITHHESKHNHPLSKTCGDKREWNSHRQIEPFMKDMIKYLRQCNVSLTKVHCIMGSMFGNMGDVPWTKRSLRTICNQITRDMMDDDIRKTMEIFKDMHEKDPGFQFSAELDKRSRIRTLLWCSGRAREQYACFGDVVTFDTTYCTNIYKMPFGLFVGVNNHFQTTIFGGVLMRRETTKSFKWVFKEFLKLMGGKAPLTILTDQCKAMTKAIRLVMPDTYHLWCKWHVMKKIRESLGPLYTKNKKFRDEFWLVVNGMLTEDEFEAAWADMVKRYRLENNGFMQRIYKCKKKWAKPWSKDKFCARMSSTQRSESANFLLKRFVPRNSSMNQFVSQYNKLLCERDREEDVAEHKTNQLKMVHSRLWAIERHALSIYTRAAFELFRSEVDKASNYKIDGNEGNVYTISHDNAPIRARWARVHFNVEVLDGGGRYVCECGLYEHFGMLCCHSIRLMLQKDIAKIPDAHIMKRWTKDARDVLPGPLKAYQKDQTVGQSATFRHRLMQLQSAKLMAKGDMDIELFEIVMKHMKAAEIEAEKVIAARSKDDGVVQDGDSSDDEVEVNTGRGEMSGGGVQSDGEVLRNNKYGASGSSAVYSDTEIINMKAPALKKIRGRERCKRFMAGSESSKKWKKNNKKKTELDCGEDDGLIEGHTACTNSTEVIQNGGAAGSGAKKNNKGSKRGKREVICGRCGIKGHNATQCCSIEITEVTAAAYL